MYVLYVYTLLHESNGMNIYSLFNTNQGFILRYLYIILITIIRGVDYVFFRHKDVNKERYKGSHFFFLKKKTLGV